MNKKDYPLWLKVSLKFPLCWKHWLREKLEMAEFWSRVLVIGNDTSILEFIENTDYPDFDEFERRLNELRKAWGKPDPHIEGFATRGRIVRVMFENNEKNSPTRMENQ